MMPPFRSLSRTFTTLVLGLACATPPPEPVPVEPLPDPVVPKNHHTPAEWDAIVAAADRSQAAPSSETDRPKLAVPLTTDAAYAAIPHRRTRLDAQDPALDTPTTTYLERVFALMDDGVRVRVHTLMACLADECAETVPTGTRDLRALAAALDRLPAPTEALEKHKSQVTDALRLQADAFDQLAAGADPHQIAQLDEVRKSSRLLKTAWRSLEGAVRGVNRQNRDAFFDHHCALDFI